MEDYSCLLNKITIGPSKNSKYKKLKKLKHESDEEVENTIELKENMDNKYEKIEGNLFKYEGTAIHIIYEDEKPWFRAKDIATILEYNNTTQAIRYNVDKNNCKIYATFKEANFSSPKNIQKNTIYIDKEGLFNLILESKAKGAKTFKKWVAVLLKKIDNNESIDNNDEIKKDFVIVPNNEYHDWGVTNNLSEVKNKRIIYLGAIGVVKSLSFDIETNVKEGEMLFKYGITSREERRQKEHIANIDSYVCFHVKICVKDYELEKDLENEFKRKGLLRNLKFKNQRYTELFVTSEYFTINDIKKYIDDWIEKYDHEPETSELKLARELTKQEIEKTKQEEAKVKQTEANKVEFEYKKMELEYKMSQENKLVCNVQKIKK